MRRSWLRLFLTGVLLFGALTGWLVWSGTGARLLHQEIETQLSRRLGRAVSLDAVTLQLERGLLLSVRNLRIQPGPDPAGEPLLRAGRIVASIDIPALLIGELALGSLVLEGPSLRLERDDEGRFSELPLPDFEADPVFDRGDVYGEGLARAVEALEPMARDAASRFRFARRIEIRDGTVLFVGRRGEAAETPLRLELLQLQVDRNRLSEASALALEAVVVDGRNAPFPVSFAVRREEDQPFTWDLSFQNVSLAAARELVPSLPLLAGLTGRWSAELHVTRDAADLNRVELKAHVENASLALPRSREKIAYAALDLSARVELARDSVRIREGKLGGRRIRSDFEITVDRPLRPASQTRLETRLLGVELEDVRDLTDALESEFATARSMHRLIERVESGRIQQIEAAGTASLRDWQALWRGPDRDLPEGFLLAGRFDRLAVASDSASASKSKSESELRDLAGEVEWIGDKLVLRKTRGRLRDMLLPEMDLSIDGVSHLVRAIRHAEPIRATPPPLPGLRPLARILRPRDPNALPPVKAIGLELERLEHPLLRWPLTAAQVLVVPVRRGVQIGIREGLLGNASVSGEIVWSSEPGEGRVEADLVFATPTTAVEPAAARAEAGAAADAEAEARPGMTGRTTASQAPWPAARWGTGRIEMEFRPRPRLPFAKATGYFHLDGADLVAREVGIALAPQGTIETRGIVGLEDPETVGLDLSFALTDGRFESLSEFIALPAKLITGGLAATGNLAGRVRPDASFVAELDGRIRANAKKGRVALGVPLLLRLSRATEGYNPFANEDEIGYETMSATIDLEHGRLDSQDFQIEGPLRVYAKARIDTNPRPVPIRAVVGIFLFRAPNEILSNVPILRSLLPGSERGLIGAYFKVDGAIREPEVEALPLASFLTAVPSAIKTPMKVLQYLFNQDGRGNRKDE